jgi:uncharacterized protein (TIGR00369 family)
MSATPGNLRSSCAAALPFDEGQAPTGLLAKVRVRHGCDGPEALYPAPDGLTMTDQDDAGSAEALTHTPDELLARYHKAMGGRPVAALEIEEYSAELIVARARFEDTHARPGGMVAGPILFTLVDTMAYFVTISHSPKRSEAFTASISMEFLRPAPIGILIVEGRLLRFGRRSCVVDTVIRRAERKEPVAHAVVSYAPMFPDKSQG